MNSPSLLYRGRIQKEPWVWDPMVELTISSPYLKVDFEIQLSIPTTKNADEYVFFQLLKNEETDRKRRVRGRGREGVGADFIT
jgi:hypothetical protein